MPTKIVSICGSFPNSDLPVRPRVARALAATVPTEAVDALIRGLD